MNLGMLQRAFLRHRYVKNRPAYEGLLRHIDAHGDVWKAPQRDVAAWWEARQVAALDLRVAERETLQIGCALEGAVVEIDGGELRIPPFTHPISASQAPGAIEITFHCGSADQDFAMEVFGHLGYRHIVPAYLNDAADIRKETLEPIYARLRETAAAHQRYGDEDLSSLRSVIRSAHQRRGIPDLRLWTLPHRKGRPYRVCVSPRFDVDRAIVNMPLIHDLEGPYGMRSTAYVRPCGPFYGAREIRRYLKRLGGNEIALHGEFVTTAGRFGDEFKAAAGEKRLLEFITGMEAAGICMHGGELSSNMSNNTRPAIEAARFKYETLYRNGYFLPLHLPSGMGTLRTLSIGQHFADLNVKPGPGFADELLSAFIDRFSKAVAAGGFFVPVLHPLFFDFAHYLADVENLFRLGAYMPKYAASVARMRRGQSYLNKTY
ncbi:MAG: hypothetical protein PHD74_04120 [Candidatus Krumholzibacteria bacterium]|nr:hypothetical protein [Candidatus Krumholzibacteria bacterium]